VDKEGTKCLYSIPKEFKGERILFAGYRYHLLTYQKSGSLNANFIIQCLDAFCLSTTKPTVIVLDNASLHTCQVLEAKKQVWEQKGLYIFFLPKYSPYLNRIERLWKQVKYHWLKGEDCLSLDARRHFILSS
jgi:transposase